MRAALVAGALLGVLSLGCGGTFCDEYPEACGAVGGGNTGGTGGEGGGAEPPGPFDVAVTLVDYDGLVIADALLLVSDVDGAFEELTNTESSGTVTVTVPSHGLVTVFHERDDGVKFAFSAEVVPNMAALTFQMPVPAPTTPAENVAVTADCGVQCKAHNELSLACRPPVALAGAGFDLSTTVAGYQSCPGKNGIDAFLVGYDAAGKAVLSTTLESSFTASLDLPQMGGVDADERFDLEMTIDGLPDGADVQRSVRVPYADGIGYGFSRIDDGVGGALTFSLVKEYVQRAYADFELALSSERRRARREAFASIQDDTTAAFVVESIALPKVLAPVNLENEFQPLASFELEEGPLGDAVQLHVTRNEAVWVVTLAPRADADFSFPALPNEVSLYTIQAFDEYIVQHIDADEADDYAAFIQLPILDYTNGLGPRSVTLAQSNAQ